MSSRIITKPKGDGSTLEETWPDHTISSAVTATKLLLRMYTASSWREEEEDEEQQKGEMQFFLNSSTFEFLTFQLSYCIYSFFMTSRICPLIFFFDKCCLKAGLFEFLFNIRPMGKGWSTLNRECYRTLWYWELWENSNTKHKKKISGYILWYWHDND